MFVLHPTIRLFIVRVLVIRSQIIPIFVVQAVHYTKPQKLLFIYRLSHIAANLAIFYTRQKSSYLPTGCLYNGQTGHYTRRPVSKVPVYEKIGRYKRRTILFAKIFKYILKDHFWIIGDSQFV